MWDPKTGALAFRFEAEARERGMIGCVQQVGEPFKPDRETFEKARDLILQFCADAKKQHCEELETRQRALELEAQNRFYER